MNVRQRAEQLDLRLELPRRVAHALAQPPDPTVAALHESGHEFLAPGGGCSRGIASRPRRSRFSLPFCRVEAEVSARTIVQRGYGARHKKLRESWAPRVAAGGVSCARCGGLIRPGEPWDLGHSDVDRSVWTGPEHRSCNRGARPGKPPEAPRHSGRRSGGRRLLGADGYSWCVSPLVEGLVRLAPKCLAGAQGWTDPHSVQ